MGSTADTIPKKSENVVFRKIEGEYILVPIVSAAADVESIFSLNETGAAVWDKLDGKKSLKDIIAEIQEEYDVQADQLQRDVLSFIDEMAAARLIGA